MTPTETASAPSGEHANPLLSDLDARGLIAQQSNAVGLAEHLNGGSRVLYCGFDPTAPSLQAGNLVPLLALRRFQLAGHKLSIGRKNICNQNGSFYAIACSVIASARWSWVV